MALQQYQALLRCVLLQYQLTTNERSNDDACI